MIIIPAKAPQISVISIKRRLYLCRFSDPPADFTGCAAVNLLEEAAEQLIVGQTVAFAEIHDALIGMDEIVIEVRDPDAVQMLQEGDADTFMEEAAEIFTAEPEFSGDGFKSERLGVVRLDICQNLLDSQWLRLPFGEVFFYKRN
jgi:hypothetical protein